MGPGGSGPLPPTVNPGLPQASSGPAGIPVPSKPGVPGVLSNSARVPSPQVRNKNTSCYIYDIEMIFIYTLDFTLAYSLPVA